MKTLFGIIFFVFLFIPILDGLTVNITNGILNETITQTLNSTQEQFLVFSPNTTTSKPYRIHTWINDTLPKNPVLVTVQHQNNSMSWSIPSDVFVNVSRILCQNNSSRRNLNETFVVILSTFSKSNITVYILVKPVEHFFLTTGEKYSTSISPSEPSYFLYTFPNGTKDDVLATVVLSSDDECLTVSIQENHCPVNDLQKDVTYEGKYEEISYNGSLRIKAPDYRNGFFLVLVSQFSNDKCQFIHYLQGENDSKKSLVNFSVTTSTNNYFSACMAIAGMYFIFMIIVIILVYLFTHYQLEGYNLLPEEDNDNDMTVDRLATKDTNERKSKEYGFTIFNAAVFYGIPVVQLILTIQKVVSRTGNEDICYANFQSATPVYGIGDFNHVFSNIGYVLLGILFLGIVKYRSTTNQNRMEETGIPKHYGIFYAMGIALINLGILSALYHICPNAATFQYDTSFIYVIAVLCMIKLYESRHSDVVARAYTTFSVLGILVFTTTIGLVLDDGYIVQIIATIIYVFLCFWVSLKIYFFTLDLDDIRRLLSEIHEHGIGYCIPERKKRFWVIAIANVINYIALGVGISLIHDNYLDFGTLFLMLSMFNGVLYIIIYTSMKFIYREGIGYQAVIYGILALIIWAGSPYFFFKSVHRWASTPEKSEFCGHIPVFLGFYGNHDIWHFLSSAGVFFTFMYILCLDDNVDNHPRNRLKIF